MYYYVINIIRSAQCYVLSEKKNLTESDSWGLLARPVWCFPASGVEDWSKSDAKWRLPLSWLAGVVGESAGSEWPSQACAVIGNAWADCDRRTVSDTWPKSMWAENVRDMELFGGTIITSLEVVIWDGWFPVLWLIMTESEWSVGRALRKSLCGVLGINLVYREGLCGPMRGARMVNGVCSKVLLVVAPACPDDLRSSLTFEGVVVCPRIRSASSYVGRASLWSDGYGALSYQTVTEITKNVCKCMWKSENCVQNCLK